MGSHLDHTSFLTGTNATFVAELYSRYLGDPAAVDGSWGRFFADLDEPDDIEVIGLDVAENAVAFAEQAGLLDQIRA